MKDIKKNIHLIKSHRQIVILVGVMAIIGGLGGWWVSRLNSGPKLTVVQKTTRGKCIASSKVKKNIKNLCDLEALNTINSTAYTLIHKSTAASGTVTTVIIKADGKGNYSYTTPAGNYIYYNHSTFIQDPASETWYEYTPGTKDAPAITYPVGSIFDITAQLTQHAIAYTYIGTIPCGLLTCYKYQKSDPAHVDTNAYLWFDNKNYQFQGFSSKDNAQTIAVNMSYGSVKITPPPSYINLTTVH